jgi:hypothetical protein
MPYQTHGPRVLAMWREVERVTKGAGDGTVSNLRAVSGTIPDVAAIRPFACALVFATLAACGSTGGSTSPVAPSQAQATAPSSTTRETATPIRSATAEPSEAAVSPDCPAQPVAVDALIGLDADPGPLAVKFPPVFGVYNERAATCYGDRPLTFRAFVAAPEGLGGTVTFEIQPSWIGTPTFMVQPSGALAGPPAFGVGPFLMIGVRPDEGDPFPEFAGSWVLVSGHFGDEAAASCRASGSTGPVPTVDEAIAICRTTFVLDTIGRTTPP